MIHTPEITTTEAQIAAVIHLEIPREQVQAKMGPAIEELRATIEAQGRSQVGPVFTHHLTTSPDRFDFEVGIPVDRPISKAGRVTPGELPAGKVARTVYRGPYEALFEAWSAFSEWFRDQGLTGTGTLWERYVQGPETDPDPSTFETELNLPLAS